MKRRITRGFTLIELLVVIAIIALLMGLLLPALAKALDNARTRKDQGQLKGVVTTFATYAEQDKRERFPLPGEVNRQLVNMDGGVFGDSYRGAQGLQQIQGHGKQDFEINLSGWLHSYMIGANYYDPSILISANEKNPMVAAKGDQGENPQEIAYNYDIITSANDVYWDPLFSGDISGAGIANGTVSGGVADVCHTSYANLALCGERIRKFWTNGDHHQVILSSRGPQIDNAGDVNNANFTDSPTLLLYGPQQMWEGIYATADASAHYAQSMWFDGITYKPQDDLVSVVDNSFMADFTDYDNDDVLEHGDESASGDIWMTLSVGSTETDINAVWDILQ